MRTTEHADTVIHSTDSDRAVEKSTRPDEMDRVLAAFLSGDIEGSSLGSDAASIAGKIRASLERAGAPIGPYDILIAAQALSLGATLVTAKQKEFSRVTGLAWKDWTL